MAAHLRLVPGAAEADLGRSAPSPIRVVLADDHDLMRRSLRLLLEREDDVAIVGEARSMAWTARHVRSRRPNVLVLDLGMSTGSRFETVSRLRARAPDTQIVGLTMENNPRFAQQALASGALGFVLKDLADGELLPAIRAAACGKQYVSPSVASRLEIWRRTHGQEDVRLRKDGSLA